MLETFEDGLLNVPNVTASAGAPFGPGGITDSVDGDDGTIDGSGVAGWSFFSGSGAAGITFTFNPAAPGGLPTQVDIVWTDGAGTTSFEAFGPGGVSLGVIGPVYPIAEPNLLEAILGKLRAAGEDGTLARLQRESLERVRRGVEDPAPVAGLSRTRQPRRFHHDPSIVVQEAIHDADGRVIVPPGTVVTARISAVKAGLDISINDLEAHFLAGGHVVNVVNAMISADKANIALPFKRAAAIDLAGRNVLEAVLQSTSLPVSVKMRKGWSEGEVSAPWIAELCEEVGVGPDAAPRRTVELPCHAR